jgi:cysteine-rich repeat protein
MSGRSGGRGVVVVSLVASAWGCAGGGEGRTADGATLGFTSDATEDDSGPSTTSGAASSSSDGSSGEPSSTSAAESSSSASTEDVSSTSEEPSTSAAATTEGTTTEGATTAWTTTEEGTTGALPACGDGVVDMGEECDDGAMVDGDGCNADCTASGKLLWQDAVGGLMGQNEEAFGAAVDSKGNFYVTGTIALTASNHDLWHRKYNGEGEELWTLTHAGPAGTKDVGRAAAVAGGEALYIGGYQAVSGQSNNALLLRYDAEGKVVWTRSFNGSNNGSDLLTDAALDAEGNVVAVGQVNTAADGHDVWMRKYSAAGGVMWTRTYGGAAKGHDIAYGVAVASNGSLFVVGTEVVTNESNNMWLGKYDADGNLLWSKVRNGAANKADFLFGAAVDPSGDVVVCGYEGMNGLPWQVWVRRYSAAGEIVWTDTYAGSTGEGAISYDIARDAAGDFVITGGEVNGGIRRIMVRKYSPEGAARWTQTVPPSATGPDHGRAVAIAPDNSIYVVGTASGGAGSLDMWFGRFSQ